MNKHTLETFVERSLSQREIAQKLQCSQATIKYWLKKFGLKTFRSKKGNVFCRRCGERDPAKLRKGCRYICLKCDSERTVSRFRRYKQLAVEYKGGKCEKCGYHRCLAALDFHHADPLQKDPNWKKMRNRSFDTIRDELDKCILVCSNCHAEIHYNVAAIV